MTTQQYHQLKTSAEMILNSAAQIIQMLKIHEPSASATNLGRIQLGVAADFGQSPEAMTSKRRTAAFVEARQVAMYLCRQLTSASLEDIGLAFGGRNHGTVNHAVKTIQDRCATESKFAQRVAALAKILEA